MNFFQTILAIPYIILIILMVWAWIREKQDQ